MFFPELEKPENIKVLIVDDDPVIRNSLKEILIKEGYAVYEAENGKEALEKINDINPDIVLADYLMPEMDGISLCRAIKNDPDTLDIGVILITGINDLETRVKGLSAGADDFLTKPFFLPELKARISSLAKIKVYRDFLKKYQSNLEKEVEKKTAELLKAHLNLIIAYNEIKELSLEIIHRLAKAAEYRDAHTGFHIQRVSQYSTKIGEAIGLDKKEIELIQYGSPLHDIGKLGIPDCILLKPGPLTSEEWRVMKKHTTIGANILRDSKIEFLRVAQEIALYHHEKWDGTGYPLGLKGEEIPLFARITAIADVFDALTTDRPYRKALSVETALEIIKKGKGTHFDPALVDAFFKIKDDILEVKEILRDNGKDEKHHELFYFEKN